MGDWERTFGAGVSAEDIISRLNAEWYRESENSGECYSPTISAFAGDSRLKTEVLRELDQLRSEGAFCVGSRPLAKLSPASQQSYIELEKRTGVPSTLLELVDSIFENLTSQSPTQNQLAVASEWPGSFVNAIRPGANLASIVDQFIAEILVDVARFTGASGACSPALSIIEIRARQISVPTDIALLASRLAWQSLDEHWLEGEGSHAFDLAVGAIATAAEPDPDLPRAAYFAAKANAHFNSDGCMIDGWQPFLPLLLKLISEAKAYQQTVIDLSPLFTCKEPDRTR